MEQQFFTIRIERQETRMERLERRKRETRRRRRVNGETGGRRSPETVRSPTWARRRSRSGKAGGRHDS